METIHGIIDWVRLVAIASNPFLAVGVTFAAGVIAGFLLKSKMSRKKKD